MKQKLLEGQALLLRAKELGVSTDSDQYITIPGSGTVAVPAPDYELQRRVLEAERHIKEAAEPPSKSWHETGTGKIAISVIGGLLVALIVTTIVNPLSGKVSNQATQRSTDSPSPPTRNAGQLDSVRQNPNNRPANTLRANGDASTKASEIASGERPIQPLMPQQERLLQLLGHFQRKFGASKLVISRAEGRIYYDGASQRDSAPSLIQKIFGVINERNAGKFEDLIDSMPSEYIRTYSEMRLDNPYVIGITKAGREYINELNGNRTNLDERRVGPYRR